MKCYYCKEEFNPNELVSYAAPGAKTLHKYCPACLEAKQKRDLFINAVCSIFGIKAPGPRIWTERKRLIENGFTDDTIIECLNYLYNVEKINRLNESLCYINPAAVARMNAYKKSESQKWEELAGAVQQKIPELSVAIPVQEKKIWKDKYSLEPDDWLDV